MKHALLTAALVAGGLSLAAGAVLAKGPGFPMGGGPKIDFESLDTDGNGEISREALKTSLDGWVAHVRHGDTYGLRRALISSMIIPKRIATPHERVAHLRQSA